MNPCFMESIQRTNSHHIILACNSCKFPAFIQKLHSKLITHRIFRIHPWDLHIDSFIRSLNDHMILQAFFLKLFHKTIYTFCSLPLSPCQGRSDKRYISVPQIKQMSCHHPSHNCIILINGIYSCSFLFITDDNQWDCLRQFLYLLLFNSFMSENSSQASSNIGSSVSAATGLEFVSNMVSNWLSSSDYNVVIRYRPKSELTSDEVDFGLSKSLINNRLFVEVEGNYLIDNKQAVNSSMSNFMGEAYITYLIDRAGTLKLKAFTQTIDRFDENQGLQETGIGVYFKEDFDNLRDLRQRIKERFTNKKRKARRIARRTARAAEKAAEDADRSRLREPADTLSPFGYVKEEEDE